MLKKYEPITAYYRDLLAACREEIKLLGYGAGTVRLNGAGELLQWLEGRGRTNIAAVNKADLVAFLEYLQARPSRRGGALSLYTVSGYVFSIGLFFDYCERHGLRGGSPLASISPPKLPPSTRYVATREEITQLYTAAKDGRATAVLHLLYGCGLRRMEVEKLDVGDVNYVTALLYVRSGKGRKRRVIPLTETVVAGLKNYQRKERWRWVVTGQSGKAFLLNDRGGRMRGATLERQLRVLVHIAKVSERITPHALRHAVATHLVAGGMKLERVRDFLGHEHLETTQIYTHVKPENE